jgi:hypothetical protein
MLPFLISGEASAINLVGGVDLLQVELKQFYGIARFKASIVF